MNVRHHHDDAQIVSLPDGDTSPPIERGEWFDTTPDHARQLAAQGWELESVLKAKRTKARKAAATSDASQPADESADDQENPPAEPVSEEND